MSVRIRFSLVGSNEKYAYRANQSIAINNALFRYDCIVAEVSKSAFAKFSEQEYIDLKCILEGVLFPDGDLFGFIEERLSGSDLPVRQKESLRDVLQGLSYIELCAVLSIMDGVTEVPTL